MMKEKDFDHIVKQKLEAINEAPPAYMWDKISTGMAAQGGATSTGVSTGARLLYIAASVIFIVGVVALFLNPQKTTKRSATRHFSKPEYKQQIANPRSIDLESTKNIEQLNNVSRTSDQIVKKSSSDQPLKETVKSPTNKTENTQRAVASNQNEVFPKLPSSNEIRNESIETSVPVLTPEKVDLAKEPVKSNTSFKVAVIEPSIPLKDPKGKQPEIKEHVLVSNQNSPESASQISNPGQTPKEGAGVNSKSKVDSLSSIEKVTIVTGGLPDDIGSTPSEDQVSEKGQNPKARILNKYSIGLHYGPEFLSVDGEEYINQAVDLSFNYQNMNFIVQTGLGLNFSEDRVTYDMDYKRWEYWKTQYRFDGLDLVINSNGDTVPVPVNPYYEDIYDSLNHSYNATAIEQYTSLQIPLLVGYQKDFKSFAIFVKGGIRYSIRVYQNTKDLYVPDENSKIVSYNYPKKSRAKSNIDYELSVGGVYKVNKQFQIQMEVFGRYYHYSIFEENPPSGIHPWSASIRAGLVYVF